MHGGGGEGEVGTSALCRNNGKLEGECSSIIGGARINCTGLKMTD